MRRNAKIAKYKKRPSGPISINSGAIVGPTIHPKPKIRSAAAVTDVSPDEEKKSQQ